MLIVVIFSPGAVVLVVVAVVVGVGRVWVLGGFGGWFWVAGFRDCFVSFVLRGCYSLVHSTVNKRCSNEGQT